MGFVHRYDYSLYGHRFYTRDAPNIGVVRVAVIRFDEAKGICVPVGYQSSGNHLIDGDGTWIGEIGQTDSLVPMRRPIGLEAMA